MQSPETNAVLPGKKGIAIPIYVWNSAKASLIAVRDNDEELKKAVPCGAGTFDHANQMGYFECHECNPFWSEFDPVFYPPRYSPLLDTDNPVEPDADALESKEMEEEMMAAALAAEIFNEHPLPLEHLDATPPTAGADEFATPKCSRSAPLPPDAPKKKKRCVARTQ
jgi:hypothetical protein